MPESNVIVTPESGGGPQGTIPHLVLLTSAAANWNGLDVERLLLSLETPEHHHDAHFLTLHLGAPAQIEWVENARHHTARVAPGEFTLIGADVPHEVRYEAAEVLAVSLAPGMVHRAAQEVVSGSALDRLEFIPQNGTADPQVERLGQLLKAEIESGYPSGRLFGESLGQALAAHLITHYTNAARPTAPPEESARLSSRQLHRALDFIAANLSREVPLTEISEAVGLSPYHFARLFKATVGTSPHAYVIERRVERARELLIHTDLPIAQIATTVGFSHQSHLTRHFRRLVGVTPARFR